MNEAFAAFAILAYTIGALWSFRVMTEVDDGDYRFPIAATFVCLMWPFVIAFVLLSYTRDRS